PESLRFGLSRSWSSLPLRSLTSYDATDQEPAPHTSNDLSLLGGVQGSPQLPARRHAELRVDAVQMRGDGSMREKQSLPDLTIGQPVGRHARDLQLLSRQLQTQVDPARSRSFPRGAKLLRCALAPGHRTQRMESGSGRAQRRARSSDLAVPSKPG